MTFEILSMFSSKLYRDVFINSVIHFVDNKSKYDQYFDKVQHLM